MSKKILMLHGFVQNDRIFSAKTGGLRKALKKLGYELDYPCGPVAVDRTSLMSSSSVKEVEADVAKQFNTDLGPGRDGKENELFGWWERKPGGSFYDYEIPHSTFEFLRSYILENGPYDGIMGFSQGGGMGGYLVSDLNRLLNLNKEEQPDLKFFIAFSGFRLEPEIYAQHFREHPISIPTLIVQGELDTVVAESRVMSLYEAVLPQYRTLLKHHGGHFIPNQKLFLNQITGWIQAMTSDQETDTDIEMSSSSVQPEIDNELLDMIDSMGKL
ncbi:Family of serine hydrolases 3 [Nakaseomyces bracarensis]|uniref:Family of serine hydrolases 3 n=1 Tax=Nakaseomyces bracarensis TaxID=273131 RepID=A0ABR4NXT3_9SACH